MKENISQNVLRTLNIKKIKAPLKKIYYFMSTQTLKLFEKQIIPRNNIFFNF